MRVLLTCLFALAAAAQQPSRPQDSLAHASRAAALAAEALKSPSAYERLRVLTDTIGHRLAGSDAEPKAVAWAKSGFEKDGVRVRLEPVMVPVWKRGEATAELVAPIQRSMAVLALGGSVPTPAGGVTAPVVVVGSFEELKALGRERVAGRIVLFDNPFLRTGDDFADYGRAVKFRGDGASEAARLGALAVLVRSVATASLSTPHTGAMKYAADAPKIPAAAVTIEDASLIRRLAQPGVEVRVHLDLQCRNEPDREGANVVAEVPGRGRPEEVVLIAAHLDSWDVGQGAVDDGAGCVIVMETMRLIASGPKPRRTVRAILAANEENGLRGGRAYRDAHKLELDRHVAALEVDSGAGRPQGLSVKAGAGALAMLRALLEGVLAPLGSDGFREGHGGADISPMEDYGVPLIGLELDGSRYFDWHHTHADTLDKVDPWELQQGVAALAAATWSLAEAPTTLPRLPKKGEALGMGEMIPRATFFSNQGHDHPRVSPDGARLAWLQSSDGGALNLHVRTLGAGRQDEAQITHDTGAGIFNYVWAADSRHILFLRDSDGDENHHLFAVDVGRGEMRDLTPFPGVKAQNLLVGLDHPNEVLVGLNRRDRRVFDMYRIALDTGSVRLDTENPGDVLGWTTDMQFVIRAATAFDPNDGSTIIRVRQPPDRAGSDRPWTDVQRWPFAQSSMFGQMNGASAVAGFTPDGRGLYVASSMGSDKVRLLTLDAVTGRQIAVVAEDAQSDVEADPLALGGAQPAVLISPATHLPQAVLFDHLKPEWKAIDASARDDFETLARARRGWIQILSRSRDDRLWVVAHVADNGPRVFSLYDRTTRRLDQLFVDNSALEKLQLAEMKPVQLRARDGLGLVAYLTLPAGIPDAAAKGLPMVLFTHGGPWARDIWGFDPVPQWLANRGYAVLQVQFRGSTGFGREFLNASTGQWGVGAMQHDLTDAAAWAVRQGIADPKRVAIMGYSYGGYATLAGLAFTPELYACGVDIVGPSDVAALFASLPDSWAPVKKRWVLRVGDAEHDEALNHRISPLYHVDRIRAPLLIGHGANDPRVKIAASDRIVAALRAKSLPVTYVVYPDEGHGFGRPENNLDFFGRADEFLGKCLGGRVEPWKQIDGTSAQVR